MRVGELRDALRECGEWDAKTLGKSKKKELVEMYEALERRRALGEVMRGVAEEEVPDPEREEGEEGRAYLKRLRIFQARESLPCWCMREKRD